MKSVLKWVSGVILILLGLMILTVSIFGGIIFLATGAFLIPAIFNKMNRRKSISQPLKIVIPIIGIFLGFLVTGISIPDEIEYSSPNNEEYVKLTQEQKDSVVNSRRIIDSLKLVKIKQQAELKRRKEIEARQKNTVSASKLYASYDANEVNADQNFKNKTFYVTGIVEEIKKDFMNDIYVSLKTGQVFSYVNCYLDDEDVASKLSKGAKVTFKGECKGMIITTVTMKDCEIIENL